MKPTARISSSLLLLGLAWLCPSPAAQAILPAAQWEKAADELIGAIAAADPRTQQEQEQWQQLKQSLKTAARQAESLAGFYLSSSTILSRWQGRGLRLVDNTQAQFYAYHAAAPSLREVGAWFSPKGARWYVKQVGRRGAQPLQRGDAIAAAHFHPVQFWTGAPSQDLPVQSQPLESAKNLSLKVRTTQLAQWALDETQASSRVVPLANKRLCEERPWLWITSPVASYLQSKIIFAQESCDALLVDLRNSFGEGLGKGSLRSQAKGAAKIPVVVLINRDTQEQAVTLALRLKDELGATLLGEATASKLNAQQKYELKELPWLLLIYERNTGSLRPDQELKDSLLLDEVYDAGVKQLRKALRL